MPEQYSSDVQSGLQVQVNVSSAGADAISGEITAIEPQVDPITRNFTLQATISNTDGQLRPGMYASISVPLGEADAVIAIPASAVSHRSYGTFVYVLEPARNDTYAVTQRFVTLGPHLGDLVAVTGLEPGDTVATNGLLKLRSGSTTRINNRVLPEAELNPLPPSG